MVWKFHGEGDASGASGGTPSSEHAYHGGGASSGRHGIVGKDDFSMMDNFVQDTVNDGVMMRIMVRRFWRTPRTRSSLRISLTTSTVMTCYMRTPGG